MLLLLVSLAVIGCGGSGNDKHSMHGQQVDEAKIKANLAKLSPEDRKLAEAQKYCAVEEENRLGTMGVPIKLELEGQAVFLCCKSCQKTARNNPAETLATVKKLKAKTGAQQ
jgi:hypothetical protein